MATDTQAECAHTLDGDVDLGRRPTARAWRHRGRRRAGILMELQVSVAIRERVSAEIGVHVGFLG